MEQRDLDSEGDAVVVLAGDAVVAEEEVLVELGDGVDSVAIEEVVEEDGVGFSEVEVAGAPDFVERWEKTCEKKIEFDFFGGGIKIGGEGGDEF